MKRLILLSACLLALAAPLPAVAGPPEIVVVRIFDNRASVNAVITRGEGKSEKIAFDSGATNKRLTRSSEGYYKMFERLYREGYTLQSTFDNGTNGLITLLFVKGQ